MARSAQHEVPVELHPGQRLWTYQGVIVWG